eukprot:TRINITY_DN213_c0_g1_i3.p2 TRINITY_DN213_c0_g1~~TRINITY_DN213_c0_g1_i3.p2  ORF type:complete len:72 (+),score=4.74 TRINITY_DN213_c0_g1_i3:410-625(+)
MIWSASTSSAKISLGVKKLTLSLVGSSLASVLVMSKNGLGELLDDLVGGTLSALVFGQKIRNAAEHFVKSL